MSDIEVIDLVSNESKKTPSNNNSEIHNKTNSAQNKERSKSSSSNSDESNHAVIISYSKEIFENVTDINYLEAENSRNGSSNSIRGSQDDKNKLDSSSKENQDNEVNNANEANENNDANENIGDNKYKDIDNNIKEEKEEEVKEDKDIPIQVKEEVIDTNKEEENKNIKEDLDLNRSKASRDNNKHTKPVVRLYKQTTQLNLINNNNRDNKLIYKYLVEKNLEITYRLVFEAEIKNPYKSVFVLSNTSKSDIDLNTLNLNYLNPESNLYNISFNIEKEKCFVYPNNSSLISIQHPSNPSSVVVLEDYCLNDSKEKVFIGDKLFLEFDTRIGYCEICSKRILRYYCDIDENKKFKIDDNIDNKDIKNDDYKEDADFITITKKDIFRLVGNKDNLLVIENEIDNKGDDEVKDLKINKNASNNEYLCINICNCILDQLLDEYYNIILKKYNLKAGDNSDNSNSSDKSNKNKENNKSQENSEISNEENDIISMLESHVKHSTQEISNQASLLSTEKIKIELFESIINIKQQYRDKLFNIISNNYGDLNNHDEEGNIHINKGTIDLKLFIDLLCEFIAICEKTISDQCFEIVSRFNEIINGCIKKGLELKRIINNKYSKYIVRKNSSDKDNKSNKAVYDKDDCNDNQQKYANINKNKDKKEIKNDNNQDTLLINNQENIRRTNPNMNDMHDIKTNSLYYIKHEEDSEININIDLETIEKIEKSKAKNNNLIKSKSIERMNRGLNNNHINKYHYDCNNHNAKEIINNSLDINNIYNDNKYKNIDHDNTLDINYNKFTNLNDNDINYNNNNYNPEITNIDNNDEDDNQSILIYNNKMIEKSKIDIKDVLNLVENRSYSNNNLIYNPANNRNNDSIEAIANYLFCNNKKIVKKESNKQCTNNAINANNMIKTSIENLNNQEKKIYDSDNSNVHYNSLLECRNTDNYKGNNNINNNNNEYKNNNKQKYKNYKDINDISIIENSNVLTRKNNNNTDAIKKSQLNDTLLNVNLDYRYSDYRASNNNNNNLNNNNDDTMNINTHYKPNIKKNQKTTFNSILEETMEFNNNMDNEIINLNDSYEDNNNNENNYSNIDYNNNYNSKRNEPINPNDTLLFENRPSNSISNNNYSTSNSNTNKYNLNSSILNSSMYNNINVNSNSNNINNLNSSLYNNTINNNRKNKNYYNNNSYANFTILEKDNDNSLLSDMSRQEIPYVRNFTQIFGFPKYLETNEKKLSFMLREYFKVKLVQVFTSKENNSLYYIKIMVDVELMSNFYNSLPEEIEMNFKTNKLVFSKRGGLSNFHLQLISIV